MSLYKEVCSRHQMVGGREFNTGSVVRTVSISDRDAKIMNEMEKEHGYRYELIEEDKEPTEKEIRAELLAKAEQLGLTFKKNISTNDLQKLIEENTPVS